MNLIEQLSREFGDAVDTTEATLADAVNAVVPEAIAAPRTEEAARALLEWCGREDVALIPRGGGSRIGVGARPERCDLIVSTRHLTQILDHDEGNATVSAGAGITLADLDAAVGKVGQFVPLDGARDGSGSTLGGAIAANRNGSSKLKYNSPRDQVVGLHAALSDGRLVKAGSKVVKNVSGYDLNKLFIGSQGSLGLITEVTIRLRPNDVASSIWRCEPDTWHEAAQIAQQIVNGPFEPTSLQFKHETDDFTLTARFDGGQAAVQSQLDRLPPTVEAPSIATETIAPQLRLCAVLPLQSALDWAKRAQESGSSRVTWECGIGIVCAEYAELPENAIELVNRLRAVATEASGTVVVERAPSPLKSPDFVWGEKPASWSLMQRLKASYDPAGVCSPGRGVGGL